MTKSVQKPAKAVIFARVSSNNQEEERSLIAQVSRLQEYCKQSNLEVIQECIIIESSGCSEQFTKVIDYIKEQQEPVALVVDSVDRLQRSFKECSLIDNLRKSKVLEIHFYKEGFTLNDKSSASDIMRWDFGILGAKMSVAAISDNVKRGIIHKLSKGECITKPPFGYKSILTHRRKACDIQIDEQEASVVKQIFEMRVSGSSIADIAKVATLTKSTVSGILKNPFYYGEIYVKSHDKYYPHKYKKIIDRDLFDKCQDVRMWNANSSSNYKTSVYNDSKSY